MGKRAANKQRNEKQILDKAIALFISKGDEHTTISEIVAETDLAIGTFYNYFRSKRDIWDKIITEFLMRHEYQDDRSESKTRFEFVYMTLFPIIELSREFPYQQLLVKNPALFRDAYFRNSVVKYNVTVLEEDIRQSPLFDGLSHAQYRMTAYSILGSCFEIMLRSYFNGDGFTTEEMVRFTANLFEHGLYANNSDQ